MRFGRTLPCINRSSRATLLHTEPSFQSTPYFLISSVLIAASKQNPNQHIAMRAGSTIFAATMQPNAFDNTEIAFSHQSKGDLAKAYWLFRFIGFPWLVKLGKVAINAALFFRIPVGWALRWNVFAHFCGGETIEDCAARAEQLNSFGIGTILDFSVEGKESDADFARTFDEILETANVASGNDHIPFCVFKITGIARHKLLEKVSKGDALNATESEEFKLVTQRVDAICKQAATGGTFVLIDAEESWIQQAIDDLSLEMMRRYNTDGVVVYNTYQLYRHDRLAFLKSNFKTAETENFYLGAKLVRGAYMEKERDRAEALGYASPIQPGKSATDQDFDLALKHCAENIERCGLCVGTHNEISSQYMTRLMEDYGISKADVRIYFAQLLGMSDHISFNLASEGYNVAKYVPYGPIREVIPYLLRRAQENTSVKGQSSRELQLIKSERIRRRKA